MSASSRTIALTDLRDPCHVWPTAQALEALAQQYNSHPSVHDQWARPLHDLRISVTDRCNFRCGYCMPKSVFHAQYPYLPRSALLDFDEITRLADQFVQLGVRKLRLTGGEPLLRKDLHRLIQQLAALRNVHGVAPELTLTTNGALLQRHARALRNAGLQRLTVSLDALDDGLFRRMNDMDIGVDTVLRGLEAAQLAGFTQIKVNMVVQRGINDDQIVPMARHFRGTGMTLRFIEYMDVGSSNGWQRAHVLPSSEVLAQLQPMGPLIPLDAHAPGETAERWGYANAQGLHDRAAGEIGLISSVTQPFCGDCSRSRLSTEGKLYLCLFAQQGWDLAHWLRNGASDAVLRGAIVHSWGVRDDRYSLQRSTAAAPTSAATARRIEMSYIGG